MPIDVLPPEILGSVLEHGLEPYIDFDKSIPSKRNEFLSSICLVSARWRDIAYELPQLWSLVAIDIDNDSLAGETAYQTQTSQLRRAKNAPLDIILFRSLKLSFFDPAPDRPQFWAFWSTVTDRWEQWRSLRIGKIVVQTPQDLHRLLPTSLPNLIASKTKVEAHYTFTPIVSAPRLRFFDLRSGYLPFKSGESLIHITNLLHLNPLIPLLPTCTILRTLHLDDASVHIPWPEELVTLPSLEHITIKGSNFMSLYRINAFLVTPALRTLSFDGCPEFYNLDDPIPTLNFPSLEVLKVESCSLIFLDCLTMLLHSF